MAKAQNRIPVSIITGFLGAGKSTWLNKVLKDPGMHDVAVIINEFGEVGIDHLLVESSGDAFVELANGCLCCTLRGELIDTLANLKDMEQTGKIRPLRRVVIETTGLADPTPVMQSIIGNPVIASSFSLDGVIVLVDGVHGLSTLDHHEVARRQVAVGDVLILSKASLADADQLAKLKPRLESLNANARLIDGESQEAGTALLLVNGLYDPLTKIVDVNRWLGGIDPHVCDDHCDHDHRGHEHKHSHHHHHDAAIRSFSILHDGLIEPQALMMFIDLLRSAHGEKLLRMKAIIATTDHPDRPLVLQGVQSVFHPPERLVKWPDAGDKRTRMVLITKDLSEEFVRDLFDAFTGTPRIDRPDREALENNPLAIAGLKL